MVSHPDVLIDRIFFGFSFLVMLFVALRPVTFFRVLALGRIDKVNPRGIKAVRVIAALVAIAAAIYFVISLI